MPEDRDNLRQGLSALLDGELSGAERREAEARLAADPEARAYLAELSALRATLRRDPGIDFSRDRTAALLARIPDAPAAPRRAAARLPRWRDRFGEGSLLRPAFAAVAAAAAAIAIWSWMGGAAPVVDEGQFAAIAPDLALYEDYEVIEELDALEDFEAIRALGTQG